MKTVHSKIEEAPNKEILYGKRTTDYTHDIIVSKQEHHVTKPPRLHFHDNHELLCITQGTYKIYAPQKIYQGNGPCLIFFRRGVYHNSVRVDCEHQPFHCYVIKFTSQAFEEIPDIMLDKAPFKTQDVIIIPQDDHMARRILPKLEEIYELYKKKNPSLLRMMYSYLILIFNYMVDSIENKLALSYIYQSSKEFYIGDVIKAIMEITDQGESITVSELSKRFFVSNSKLSKDFQNVAGIGIKAFITEHQLEQINQMLEKGWSNREISERCGFSCESCFCRFYRKQTGITPGEYRKQF